MSDIQTLRNIKVQGQLRPYIDYIRFPFFKNIAPNTRIDFSFPLTALVGANGSNKSSILRALFGSPTEKNLGTLWFSTSVDEISETTDDKPCFIYGYHSLAAGVDVEVLKTRVQKEGDPDYWEPSRAILKYGMVRLQPLRKGETRPGRSGTRWNTIDKEVVLLDFRQMLSAYDKFFYHNEDRSEKDKKALIRRRAWHLGAAARLSSKTYTFYQNRIIGKLNRKLNSAEISEISVILGRQYDEITLLRHTFYDCDAYTAILKTTALKYTEAFAGSGEFAVVRLVVEVLNTPEKSLILLDEPEVSLHPGAQERLVSFLLKRIKITKLQIVLATHSPAIIRQLPAEAIKVMVPDPATGLVRLPSQASSPESAFFHIGEPLGQKKAIFVEDELAANVVKKALRSLGQAVAERAVIRFFPGGSQTLWGNYIPMFSAEGRSDLLVLFDGDRRPAAAFKKPAEIPASENPNLSAMIEMVTGVDVEFYPDGGSGGTRHDQKCEMQRAFMDWAIDHVDYLPGLSTPERFIMDHAASLHAAALQPSEDAKSFFEQATRVDIALPLWEFPKAPDILATQIRHLASVPDDAAGLPELRARLNQFLGEEH